MNAEEVRALFMEEPPGHVIPDPQALKEINQAREEIAEGHVLEAEALRAKYLAR
ncbi:MAG: hypothetical protein ACYCSF_07655 [Acidimicrobiales bacterium]